MYLGDILKNFLNKNNIHKKNENFIKFYVSDKQNHYVI